MTELLEKAIALLKTLPDREQNAIAAMILEQLGEGIDLAAQGIDKTQAEVLRFNLATFAEDWDSPEMSIYDNYDAAKTKP